MSNSIKQVISCVLVVIFALYYANISFFYNSHVVNGVTIVHSHFHGKNHEQSDTHSENELKLISVLSFFQSLQATVCFVALEVFFLLQEVITPRIRIILFRKLLQCITLRARPPYSNFKLTRHIFTKHAHTISIRIVYYCALYWVSSSNNY